MSWNSFESLPDVGRKFICLFDDGSGATMFWRHDHGYIDHDGDECYVLEHDSYSLWAYLPDGMEFWCEQRSEDPISLSLPSENRQGEDSGS